MKLHDLWRRCFGVVGGVSVPTQNLRCSLMKHVFCTGYSYDDYYHLCSKKQSLQILCNIYIYIMHFILISYTYSRKSKDQTLPLNRRESFTWIIRKTILLFGRLDFLGRNIYIYIYIYTEAKIRNLAVYNHILGYMCIYIYTLIT